MEIREIWSLPHARLEAFFLSQDDVQSCGQDLFRFGACEISLAELPARVTGSLRFPQTQVEFCGPDRDVEAIRRRFILQFISAGG